MIQAVQKLDLPPCRRILAVSDIHGNLDYFRGLLDKTGFGTGDILMLLGDMIEKGPESLVTLRFIMELREHFSVYPLIGNCDGFHRVIDGEGAKAGFHIRSYMNKNPQALLCQMCAAAGLPVTPDMDLDHMREVLGSLFAPEFDFLRSLPAVIDTEHYTFVHGGVPEGELGSHSPGSYMKTAAFMRQGRKFDKYCIVGHWPVVLYREDIPCANPIVDSDSRIISIDGGCVLKDDGQLNALIIPYSGSADFDFEYYDSLPVGRVKSSQEGSAASYYIRHGDNRVRVLRGGIEFSLCEHARTGYRMEILTKALREYGEITLCGDATDYVLPLRAGDEVSIVESTSRGYLVKRKGVTGWYYGGLA